MKNWKVELTAGVKTLAEMKIQRSIFPGDAHSPFLFLAAMMALNKMFRKYTRSSIFTKSPVISVTFCTLTTSSWPKMKKNWRLLQKIRIYSQDIGMKFGFEKCAKWKKTNNGRNRPVKSGKNQNAGRKVKL